MLLQTIYVAYDFHLLGYTSFDFVDYVYVNTDLWVSVMYVGGFDDEFFYDLWVKWLR